MVNKEQYEIFKQEHGAKSGVDYYIAKDSGVNQDAFKKVNEPIEIEGELVLKIWNNKSRVKMLWCYIQTSDSEGFCFPVFRGSANDVSSIVMNLELGSKVRASFKKTKNGKCFCDSLESL